MDQQTEAVQRMQDYIESHLDQEITLTILSKVSLFSPWHSHRLFKERLGLTPAEYIRRMRLSHSAMRLKQEQCFVTDAAYDCGFQSIDGFTRAFYREFGCNPGDYVKDPVPIRLFIPYGVKFKELRKDTVDMENLQSVFVQVVRKPERKVILKRGVRAEDYFAYCAEVSCEVWGVLASMDSLCGEPVCLWLPDAYKKPDTSTYVQGVETMPDYAGDIPEGFDVITLGGLSRASRAIAAGNFSSRVRIRSNDEIGAVSADFNAMAEQMEQTVSKLNQAVAELHQAMERQEQFTGSFAHEMKTPMTSLIGYAELLRSGSLTPEEQAEAADYVMFKGRGDIETQLHQLLSETGYTCDTMGGSKEDSNYVIARISPAYQSGALTDNTAMLVSGMVGVALIIVTGYLIIYNIFQISVIQDIQSYGQLKTLGTTKRQIKRLINRQALRLSLIGIPIGLLIGFLIGRALVPFLMNGTSYTADAGIKVTINPLIFLGSTAFALFTVFVSVRKPAKIAGTVSAIEAIRYTENDAAAFGPRRAKDRKSTHGAKLHMMALANLGRNRKRTVLVIVSMTLSLVLFNTVFALSGGFDIDKYIAKFLDTDFVISTTDYFQFRFETSGSELSEHFVDAVRQNEHFANGGRLYASRTLEEPFSTEHNAFSSYNKDQNGNPFVSLYGADDFLLNGMEVIEGTIDLEKLKTGEYILLSVDCNDDGTVIENPNISVGDTVRINHLKAEELSTTITDSYDFIIMAKVRANENTATTRNTGEARFYLPTEIFLPLCDNPHLVSFPFDVKEGTEAEIAEFLNSYIDSVEPSMDFESKATYTSSFDDLTSLIITIGGALSIIIGIIGIANFVNSVLTSVITRKKEFAMLQSIGMTGKQLKRMLSFEGLYYAVGTMLASAVLGMLFSVVVVRGISSGIWFFTYRFVMWPMLVIYPFLILLTVAIPALLYRQIAKNSIIERLHQN